MSSRPWHHVVAAPDGVIMEIDEGNPELVMVWTETEPRPAVSAMDAARDMAWASVGIPFNSEAALYRHAQEQGLGAPLTSEYDFTFEDILYRGQGFAMGIVYAQVDDWGNIEVMAW